MTTSRTISTTAGTRAMAVDTRPSPPTIPPQTLEASSHGLTPEPTVPTASRPTTASRRRGTGPGRDTAPARPYSRTAACPQTPDWLLHRVDRILGRDRSSNALRALG